MDHSSFRKHPCAVARGPPGAAEWIPAPALSSLWTAGKHLLHCGRLQGLQGSVSSGTWYLLLLLQLSCQGYFSHIFPHPSLPGSILPFLKYTFLKAPLPPWLEGPAMPCAMLERAVSSTEQLWPPITEVPEAPPCQHLGTCTLYTFLISSQFSGLTVFLTHML